VFGLFGGRAGGPPDGFMCVRCGEREAWRLKERPVFECQGCGYQLSPTAGTVLHRSRFPLQDWFWAAYLVATHPPGLSATQLSRQMSCSYKTAWFLLHRLRRAMVSPARTRLDGRVEVDETFIGLPCQRQACPWCCVSSEQVIGLRRGGGRGVCRCQGEKGRTGGPLAPLQNRSRR